MPVAAAITGAHGVGKSYIIEKVLKAVVDVGFDVALVLSPTRKIRDLGFEAVGPDSWMLEFLCIADRVRQEQAAVQQGYGVLLSDRCLNDEIAYMEVARQGLDSAYVLQPLIWMARDLLASKSIFDVVFYKPVHPDYPIEVDEYRPGSYEYQAAVDRQMHAGFERMRRNGTQGVELPADRDEAVTVVVDWVRTLLGIASELHGGR